MFCLLNTVSFLLKAHQARIANLYLPFLTIILENKARLTGKDSAQSTPSPASFPNGDSAPPPTPASGGAPALSYAPQSQPETPVRSAASLPSYNSSVSLDSSMSPHSAATRLAVRDPGVFAMISGQGRRPVSAFIRYLVVVLFCARVAMVSLPKKR